MPKEGLGKGSELLLSLVHYIESFDLQNDHYLEMLRQKPETQEQAEKILQRGKTFCSEQLAKFLKISYHIYEELGGWATDYFIRTSVDHSRDKIENDTSMTGVNRAERLLLLGPLLDLPVSDITADSMHISPKLEKLLAFLEKMDYSKFSGLIFAKQRATVSILARILSMHPATKNRFRSDSYVGWSNNTSRKDYLGNLLSRETQRDTLSEFRAGRINLIVATDVLEEGLDVSTCSLVVCYDKPANLKSFVQRRGRARHRQSTYAILISTQDESLVLHKWQKLEQAMVDAYQDDERRRREACALESIDEHVDSFLFVPSTGARMSADDAMQHLLHFCAVLPVDEYVDNRPMFSFEEDRSGRIRGTVTLPASVAPAVRRAQGQRWWRTERASKRETAFQAYKALHMYGLVNDNLLPLTRKSGLRFTEELNLPSIIECSEQYDPFLELAHAWASPELHQTVITVSNKDDGVVIGDLSMSIVLPKGTVMPDPITLYWKRRTTLIAKFEQPQPVEATTETIMAMRSTTFAYLQALSSRVRAPSRDFVALFVPIIPLARLEEWILKYGGTEKAVDLHSRETISPEGIIRDTENYGELCFFRRWICQDDNQIYLECQSLPRRRNFLQIGTCETAPPKIRVVPASACTVDKLPAAKAMAGHLIPALLNRFEATIVASRLNDTILKGVGIKDLSHIITAITAPMAQAATDYQRYEFFGDSILKFTVSYQLFLTRPSWHEGYLSESRDNLVSNKRLARAAVETGLDRFILTNGFAPRKWDSPLISQKYSLDASKRKRNLSMKMLADVVEALIGAGYMDGGLHRAQACLHCFLPEIDKVPSTNAVGEVVSTTRANLMHDTTPRGVSNLIDQNRLPRLIGYTFQDEALLTEALTHPSCEHDTTTQSYQRLEYLGDAVLDIVVMSTLAALPHQLSQGKMTQIKHAVVNANLLAFLCMDFSAPDLIPNIEVCQAPGGDVKLVSRSEKTRLWHFLRFHGLAMKSAREACTERYKALRDQIRDALAHATEYPWEHLACLRAEKFISDILESTIGAIFIDSRGNLRQCHAFAERIGLLAFLRRIITEGVNIEHPRNAAQKLVKSLGTLIFNTKRVEAGGAIATYCSSAVMNKEEIAMVDGCASAEEAEVKVSRFLIDKFKKA